MDAPAWYENLSAIMNAVEVPARFTDAPWPGIEVRARLVWADSGEQWIDTTATAWTRTTVLVDVADPRWRLNAAWLPATDVARRQIR